MRDALLTHLPALRRYGYGLTGNRPDAEDLFQATVLRALETEKSWRGINGRAWLYTIMTNLYRNSLRGKARAPGLRPIEEGLTLPSDMPEPDPLLRDHLMAALETLNPEARAVLMLVAIEGCAYDDVAKITGAPLGTVMSRLSRARRQMAELLRSHNIGARHKG